MKVSVWMSAFNHEKYISQCLDSVLMQKTNFDFEVILGEDCSTDRTREIAIEYRNKYPDKIKLFLPEKNLGMMEMDMATWNMCFGEYIALLNGDDYWTDENKLQEQADLLDKYPDTVMCFHQARVENESDGSTFDSVYTEKDDTMPTESLLNGYNPVMTPTVMIKNIIDLPNWYPDLPYGDMPLYLLLARRGKIRYINKIMSVYRIHSNGEWQGSSVINNLLKDLKFYEIINYKFDNEYESYIRKIYSQRFYDLIINYIRTNNTEEAKTFFERLTTAEPAFLMQNTEGIKGLYQILYEGADINQYKDLMNTIVKWKVN